MRLVTGERVVTTEGGFNPSYQRHVAAYRLCAPHLPQGRVLDLGCGIGHSYAALAPRETVGVDNRAHVLAGQDRETHHADMRRLPFTEAAFEGVLSVQSLEHVPDPAAVLCEVVRVLAPGGTALFVTPNRLQFARPDEIIDPYHFHEFSPAELAALCAPHFAEVRIAGLNGSPRWRAIVDAEHARLERLLRLDPLRLRRWVPRRARQFLYDLLLTRNRVTRDDHAEAQAITPEDFTLSFDNVDAAFDLVAICREPRISGAM